MLTVTQRTWQGLGDLVNRFRVKTLRLEPVSTLWAPGQLYRQKVPYTYLWSPGLIPKPDDWGPEIDIAGFVFLDLASSFKPPDTLAEFLDAGEPPVYIGFGSIVVDDPDKFTSLIFQAVQKAGVRALVSKGWGGLGDEGNTPENIYMLENTPHDWLFPRVSAVVHHGGAGTTAIGLKCGKPTMIVPFFGDQPFWGAMVAKAGAGAHEPIPYKGLTADALAEGILRCLTPEAKEAAEKLAKDIVNEGDGAKNAAESFQRHLPNKGEHSMCCSVFPDQPAVWAMKSFNLRLSTLAAELLVREKKIKWQELRLLRHYDWNDFEGPGEPLTGGGMAIVNSLGGVVTGVGSLPVKWARVIKKEKGRNRKRTVQAEAKETGAKHLEAPETQQNGKVETAEVPFSGDSKAIEESLTLSQSNAAQDRIRDIEQESTRQGIHINGGKQDHLALHLTSESSHDNLVRELAEATGTGFLKTGEALARGEQDCYVESLPMSLIMSSSNGPLPRRCSRLPQRAPPLRRLYRPHRSPYLGHPIRSPCCGHRVHSRHLRRSHGPCHPALQWRPSRRRYRLCQRSRERFRWLRTQGSVCTYQPVRVCNERRPQRIRQREAAHSLHTPGEDTGWIAKGSCSG